MTTRTGESTPYDVVLYPGRPQYFTHPRRAATIAHLMGFEAAPVARCRVLELGCGNGTNLAAMAAGLPESEFVGVDLSARTIELGRTLLEEARLSNVKLFDGSFTDLGSELGVFDYVIAHGVYSWVPPEVRDGLLDACRRFLSPSGIAYVSYAVYPGCHLRELVRDMMLFHTDRIADPLAKVREGVEFTKFVRQHQIAGPAYAAALGLELERFERADHEYIFHDDFSDENSPVYFGAFVEHAREHGLDFLGESMFAFFVDPVLPAEARRIVSGLSGGDIVTQEQYLDFLRGRAFRQTLLCHAREHLSHELELERVFSLHVSSSVTAVESNPENLASDEALTFKGARDGEIATKLPPLKAALVVLSRSQGKPLPVDSLWQETRRLLGRDAAGTPEERELFARSLLECAAIRMAELSLDPPRFCRTPGERPQASPLARAQARRREEISTLTHHQSKLDDPRLFELLPLLDGTRSRAELVAALDDALTLEQLEALLEVVAARALLLA